jgi:hypothetical protein
MQAYHAVLIFVATMTLCGAGETVCPRGTAVRTGDGWCLPCDKPALFECIEDVTLFALVVYAPVGTDQTNVTEVRRLKQISRGITASLSKATLRADALDPSSSHIVMDMLLYFDACENAYRLCPNPDGAARFVVRRHCAVMPLSLEDCAAVTTCPQAVQGGPVRFRSASGACVPCTEYATAVSPGAPAFSLWFNATCTCDAGAQQAEGEDACELCSMNRFKSARGLGQCQPCPDISVAPIGATSSGDCSSCPNGTMKFSRLYETLTASSLICLPCPRLLETLLDYQRRFFVKDGLWLGSGDNLADYAGSEEDFLRRIVFDTRACGPDVAPYAGGSYKRNMVDFVQGWRGLTFSRAACPAGMHPASRRLATVDSAYVPCPAGQAGNGRCECVSFANVSGFTTDSAGVSSIAFTLPGTQLDTFATTGREAAPQRAAEVYVPWQYPVRAEGAASYAFGDHIERPIAGGASQHTCTGVTGVGSFDMLLAQWRAGALRLPLEYSEVLPQCQMGCEAGFRYAGGACEQCGVGTFKRARDVRANCAEPACQCMACAPGSFQPRAGQVRCLDCPIGHYCEGGAHVQPCWRANQRPSAGATCHPQTHYLTACTPNQGVRNCAPCGAPLPVSTTTWAAAGSAHCELVCSDGFLWDRVRLVCRACAVVANTNGAWVSGGQCVPVCVPGFHSAGAVPLGSDGPLCLACDEAFSIVCGGHALSSPHFADRGACRDGSNTRCTPCAEVCVGAFQQPGEVDVTQTGRMRCSCGCGVVQLPFFAHIRDVPSSALLLGLDVGQLHAALLGVGATDYGNTSHGVGAYCLRWQHSFAGHCADSAGRSAYLKFDPFHALSGSVSLPGRPQTWPSVVCAYLDVECGDSVPLKFGSQIFESANSSVEPACHCRAGLRGEYSSVDNALQSCHVCAGLGETSLAGTNAVGGCVCAAGWARTTSAASDRSCAPCADFNLSSTSYYCPGECSQAQHRAPFFAASAARSDVCTAESATPCPRGRDVRSARFASSATDCRLSAGLYLPRDAAGDAAGLRCDSDPAYNFPDLTLWTDDGVNCSRVCGHGAKPDPAVGGGCRCDGATGFRLALAGGRCDCAPGHYAADADGGCPQCPAGFYCPGGVFAQQACPTDMSSRVGSRSLVDCACFPGYAYVTGSQDASNSFCRQCQMQHYCNANCREKTAFGGNEWSGMCRCQDAEIRSINFTSPRHGLICLSTGLAVPAVCPRGHVFLYQQSVGRAKCQRGPLRLRSASSWVLEDQRVAVNLLLSSHAASGFFLYAPYWDAVLPGSGAAARAPAMHSALRGLFQDYAVVLASALQLLCPRATVFVLLQGTRGPSATAPLHRQFRCAALQWPLQVVLRARALPAQKALGGSGFVDPASLPTSDELRDPAAHLPWAVAVDCSEHVHGRVSLGDNVSCVACQSKMGQRMRLRVAAQGSWETERPGFFSDFVFVDAPTQLFWLSRAEDHGAPAVGSAAVVFLQVFLFLHASLDVFCPDLVLPASALTFVVSWGVCRSTRTARALLTHASRCSHRARRRRGRGGCTRSSRLILRSPRGSRPSMATCSALSLP